MVRRRDRASYRPADIRRQSGKRLPLTRNRHIALSTPCSRMKFYRVLEDDRDHWRIVSVGHLDAVIEAKMPLSDLAAGNLARHRHGSFAGGLGARKLLPLRVEKHGLFVQMKEEAWHGRANEFGFGRLLQRLRTRGCALTLNGSTSMTMPFRMPQQQ